MRTYRKDKNVLVNEVIKAVNENRISDEQFREARKFAEENGNEVPPFLKKYLGDYGVCFVDSTCGEPLAWGYPIEGRLGQKLWGFIDLFGEAECVNGGYTSQWFLVRDKLTVNEAKKKYGKITNTELGPRGGYRSVTFGDKKFTSRQLDPR